MADNPALDPASPDPAAPDPAEELGPDDVRKIAALARLSVDGVELGPWVEHFSKMMHFVEHLAEADDPDCEPFRLDPRDVAGLRPDTPITGGEPGSPVATSEWQRNAPATDGHYFTVPRVVGSEETE